MYSKQGATRDYTIVGNVITLNTPALVGDIITVQGFENLPALANNNVKETFTGDGVEDTWTLLHIPLADSTIVANESGLVLIETVHYSVVANAIVFTTAPVNLEKMYIKYNY